MATQPPPALVPSPLRLRLVFYSRLLLRRTHRDDGLRRCWLLLRPELATVADLAVHVAARFCLRRSCPRGVVLSMDGFVLPPFESISILRDKDIIRVKQKTCKKMVAHNDVHCIQDPEIVEKRPHAVDNEIIAIEYQKDSCKDQEEEDQGDHQPEENATVSHDTENNGTSSKRKWHDGDIRKLKKSTQKKLKVTSLGKHIGCSKEDSVYKCPDLSGSKKLISSAIGMEAKDAALQAATTVVLLEQEKTERNNQSKLKSLVKVADCNAQSHTKKLETRSARRKKLKRQVRRKAKEQMEMNLQQDSSTAADCPSSSNQINLPCPSRNQSQVPLLNHKTDEGSSDESDDIVPVVVRPGHIRFEPAGGEPNKSSVKETQVHDSFQWNGITSKKKGQKWGMNHSIKKNADFTAADSNITENGFCGVNNQKDWKDSNNGSSSAKTIAEGEPSGEPLNFESLYPLTRLPEEGDLIVYRLVELSSSWCPELSSYRVGEVLIYDPISLRIILLPVPGYPIQLMSEENKPEDESDMPVDLSPYKEDGSLEIEYSSLLDVRLLKGKNELVSAVASSPFLETCKKSGSLTGNPVTLDKNRSKIESQKISMVPNNAKDQEGTPEKTAWREKGEPPNDKPEIQENGWGTWTPNSSTSAWSYRALRSSALGPTMAILRGKNSHRGKPLNRKYRK